MEEEKKKKSLLSWRDAMKMGIGFAVGFTMICIIVFFIGECSSNSRRNGVERRIETAIDSWSEKKLVVSGVTADGYETFDNDTIGVFKKDGKYGYYNVKTKEIVIAADYEKAKRFSQGLAAVVKNNRVGFINLKGETVIGFDYTDNKLDGDDKCVFRYGYCAIANVDGKYGVIDLTGKWVIAPEYMDATVCKDYAIVKVKDSFNMQIDYSGHIQNGHVVDKVDILWIEKADEYGNADFTKETKYCMYTVNGRCGLMDCNGNILTAPIYLYIKAIGNELFAATLLDNNAKVVLNGKGEVISR